MTPLPSLLLALAAHAAPTDAGTPPAIAGLGAPVQVSIDGHGVPHIVAADLDDAAAATGWLHARDRAFQLALLRHASQGRLTELFGAQMEAKGRATEVWGRSPQKRCPWLPVGPYFNA